MYILSISMLNINSFQNMLHSFIWKRRDCLMHFAIRSEIFQSVLVTLFYLSYISRRIIIKHSLLQYFVVVCYINSKIYIEDWISIRS